MKIIELPEKEYKYHELHYTYVSNEHYVPCFTDSGGSFSFSFKREKAKDPIIHDSYDTLYEDYWQNCTAYGMVNDDGEIIAYLETEREEWNNRLRIANLLVDEKYRGKGIGTKLVDFVKKTAVDEDYRIIILETQSCNVPAIDFYKKNGFTFAGTNLYFYSNVDTEDDEVMLEMAYTY